MDFCLDAADHDSWIAATGVKFAVKCVICVHSTMGNDMINEGVYKDCVITGIEKGIRGIPTLSRFTEVVESKKKKKKGKSAATPAAAPTTKKKSKKDTSSKKGKAGDRTK